MAGDRGEYTPIPSVLLDGKDFQQLTERANHLFLVLKINMGPTGIEVHYPAALAIQLSAQSRIPLEAIEPALDEMEQKNWIRREANMIWIIDHLRYHPNMDPANSKHRKGVCNYTKGLPRLAIVRAFIDHYPDYFADVENPAKGYPGPSDSLSVGYGMPIESRSTQYADAIRSTQYADGAESKINSATEVVSIEEGKRKEKRGSQIPASWQPTDGHRELAAGLALDVADEADRFRDHAKAQGRVCKDWDAAFRNWLKKAPDFKRPKRQSADDRLLENASRIMSVDLSQSRSALA